jgi:hypothetical protein
MMMYYVMGIVGIGVGCLLGYVLSTMITVKRSIQDIHNAVCPTAAGDREKAQ